jgi:hypothetical protein
MDDNPLPLAPDPPASFSLSLLTPGSLSPLAVGVPSSSTLPNSMAASDTSSLALAVQTEAPIGSLPIVTIAQGAAAVAPMEKVAQAAVGSSLNPLIPMPGAVSNVGTSVNYFCCNLLIICVTC